MIEKVREDGAEEKSILIAKRLIARGESNVAIAEITDLSESQIEDLRKQV